MMGECGTLETDCNVPNERLTLNNTNLNGFSTSQKESSTLNSKRGRWESKENINFLINKSILENIKNRGTSKTIRITPEPSIWGQEFTEKKMHLLNRLKELNSGTILINDRFAAENNNLTFLKSISDSNALDFLNNDEPKLINPLISYLSIIKEYMDKTNCKYKLNVVRQDDPEDKDFKILVIMIDAEIDDIDKELEIIEEIGLLLDEKIEDYLTERGTDFFDKISLITYILEADS